MGALAIWTAHDGLLSAVAPLGLAAAAGTALMVDLDSTGPSYPGDTSLADLVADGPRRADLSPSRSGVAVLRNGGVEIAEAHRVVAGLTRGWPNVVLRTRDPGDVAGLAPVVPVWPLLPGALVPRAAQPAVYQRTGYRAEPSGPGPVLPRPRPAVLGALLEGVVERRWRWIRAWRQVWGMPWR